jgi:hypothetical protein
VQHSIEHRDAGKTSARLDPRICRSDPLSSRE